MRTVGRSSSLSRGEMNQRSSGISDRELPIAVEAASGNSFEVFQHAEQIEAADVLEKTVNRLRLRQRTRASAARCKCQSPPAP